MSHSVWPAVSVVNVQVSWTSSLAHTCTVMARPPAGGLTAPLASATLAVSEVELAWTAAR